MQIFCKSITIILMMAALTTMAARQAKAEGGSLTMAEIIATAKESNAELRALRAEKGVGEAGRIRAGLYPNPTLELDGATGAMTGSSSENRLGVGISQEFLTGDKRQKRLAVTDAELLRFDHQYRDFERRLVAAVKLGYYDLLLAEGRRDLAVQSRELGSQLLQFARERFAVGEIAELDVNLARVEAGRSEVRSMEAEREMVGRRQQLLTLMGDPSGRSLKLARPEDIMAITTDLPALKALALQQRPDLMEAAAERQKNDAELALSEAEQMPNVTAGLGVSWERSETSLGGLDERNDDYLIGVKLSIPLLLFDKNQAGIRETLARKSRAEIRQQNLRQTIVREVESAYARLAVAEKTQKIYEGDIIPQLTENLQLTREAYRLGETGIVAVIEEQKKFIEVSEAHLLARHERNRAVTELEAAVGLELNKLDGGAQ